jgi:hypothetical protein
MANGLKSESQVRLPSSGFDENYQGIFGSRTGPPVRGKWRVDPATGQLVDWDGPTVEAKLEIIGDEKYNGLAATDGTPIDTRKRHRQYMKDNNLSLHGDYSPEYYKKRKEAIGRENEKECKRDMLETIHKLEANPRLAVRRRENIDPNDD